MAPIHWFPGHMRTARRQLGRYGPLAHAVLEVVDARAPATTLNADLSGELPKIPRVLVLNKADLAPPGDVEAWLRYLRHGPGSPFRRYAAVVATDASRGRGVGQVRRALERLAADRRPIRAVVLGVPNVGKSSLLNRLAGRRAARSGALAGVTRQEQWIRLGADLELLDLPGLLWPKLADQQAAIKLAAIGSVPDRAFDLEAVADWILCLLRVKATPTTRADSGLPDEELPAGADEPPPDGGPTEASRADPLSAFARRRGLLRGGGEPDRSTAARVLLRDFQAGRFGPVSLDEPPSVS